MSKLSITYRFLNFIGLNYSEEEYGQITFFNVIKRTLKTFRDTFLLKYYMNSVILAPLSPRKLRPWVLRKVGCKVGKGVFIGESVSIDAGHAKLIEIEDGVHIAGHSILLCHQRDMSKYFVGSEYGKLPYKHEKILLKKGCLLGTHVMVMPGVTIGEGAIVGAYSLVTKDVPAWTIATGRPARVIKNIPEKEDKITLKK